MVVMIDEIFSIIITKGKEINKLEENRKAGIVANCYRPIIIAT